MPSNRPTSAELLEAVQKFLKAEVLPALSGSSKYHVQVALTALGVVGRELAGADQLDRAERARLADLLNAGGSREELNRLLCLTIRERRMTYRDPALMEHLRLTTMGKMSIDNPKYATYLHAQECS
jgi:Domain of unknown function (DUF6285)